MESKFEQMTVIQSFCKDELDLLQNNIKVFLKQCEYKCNIIRKLVVNNDAMYLLDRHITELTNVLNLARKFNISMEADEWTNDGCNGTGTCAGAAFNVSYNNVLLQSILRCGNVEHNNNCMIGLKKSMMPKVDHVTNLEICDDSFIVNSTPSPAKNYSVKAIKDSDNNAKYSAGNQETPQKKFNNNIIRSKLDVQCILNFGLPRKQLDHYIRNYEFDASITHVQDYANLTFYLCAMDEYNQLFQFRKTPNMQAIDYNNIPDETVFCVMKNKGGDGDILWRAIINPQTSESIKENSIYLVDYGEVLPLKNNDTVNQCALYELPPEYQKIPPLAIRCILEGVLTADGIIKSEQMYLETTLRQYECKTVKFQVTYRMGNDLHVILIESLKDQNQSNQINCNGFNGNPFLSVPSTDVNKQCDFTIPTKASTSYEQKFDELSVNDKLPLPAKTKPKEVSSLIVTHVDTPITFFGIREGHSFFWGDDEVSVLQKQFTSETQPKVNDIVLSQYIKDGFWYRARILHIHKEKHTYKVFYIDYGNIEIVPLSCLAKCTKVQLNSPGLAIRCRLANLIEHIEQNNDCEQQQKQYEKALQAATDLILNQTIQIHVVQKVNEELTIHIVDPQYADLSQILLDMGVVQRTNMKFQSQEETVAEKEIDYGSSKLNEYLIGSRRMTVLPIALSLLGSYVSGVTIVGSASEIYTYGTQYSVIAIAIIMMTFPLCFVYLPVFTSLGVHSSYEYLERRFGRSVRTVSAFLFIMDEILFLPMIVHVPALALHKVSGVNEIAIAVVMCVVCVTYTLIGGIKAVVHTDAWQVFIMLTAVFIIVILAIVEAGGFAPVIDSANKGGRIVFTNISPTLVQRETFWSVCLGGFCYWTAFNSVNQTMVQRYLTLPTLQKARQAIAIFTTVIVLFIVFCCFAGLLIYYTYRNCDPLAAGIIKHMDELFPAFVVEVAGKYPGVPGLFIAGIFGAGLSSLSVVLNTTALVIMEDIGRGVLKLNFSPAVAAIVVKVSVVVLGFFSLLLIFALQRMGGILSVAYSITALSASINFGLFNLGMLIPWSNWKGSLIGAICGYLFTAWISIGQQVYLSNGWLHYKSLPVDVSGCSANITQPKVIPPTSTSEIFPLYMLSYHFINVVGLCTTVLIGTIASFATGHTKLQDLDLELLSPITRRLCELVIAKKQQKQQKLQKQET